MVFSSDPKLSDVKEKTEVIYGAEDIVNATLDNSSRLLYPPIIDLTVFPQTQSNLIAQNYYSFMLISTPKGIEILHRMFRLVLFIVARTILSQGY